MKVSGKPILCIGDVMLDRFAYGDMDRISPEAPVPVLRLKSVRETLGGAGNVASNIASLGGEAVLIGLLGTDAAGDRVRRLLTEQPGLVSGCLVDDTRVTTCKTRYIAVNQQVVRTDEETFASLTPEEEQALLAAGRDWIARAGAVVLSDYGKGVLSPLLIRELIAAARERGVAVFVDPKSLDFGLYRGATCITPNLKELAAASGMPVNDDAAVIAAARHVLAQAHAQAILVTRSEKGMMLVEAAGEVSSVPARAREVFDVSGAGDTVIATMALLHAAGRSLVQSMHVANAAASVVVSKLGTATAEMSEVMHELDAQDHARGLPSPAVQPIEAVRNLVLRWKQQGMVVGFTNGCFDLLHPGHVSLLARARSECDRLIVALNTDASVSRLKGPTRPVNTLEARALVMAAVRYVDCVVAFDDDTPLELIKELLPNVLVKGADYSVANVVGADVVQAAGGRVVLASLMSGQSSTGTIARMQAMVPS